MMQSIRHWLLAARPKTLPAAVVPVWVGTVLAGRLLGGDGIDGGLAWCTLLSALAIQLATNFFNDALDAEKGADTERRLGPSRASASGWIEAPIMLRAACIALGIAVAFAIPLVLTRGFPIILIGLCSMLCAYAYTGGPFPLAYRGMGEIFVIIFFGIVAVAGTVFVQTGTLEIVGILVGIQVGLYSSVLIAINNLRDQAEDERSRKFTLAVVFGQTFAEIEIIAFCLLPPLLGGVWFLLGQLWWEAMVFPLALLPLSAAIIFGILGNVPGRIYNRFLAMSAAQLLGFAILLTLAAN